MHRERGGTQARSNGFLRLLDSPQVRRLQPLRSIVVRSLRLNEGAITSQLAIRVNADEPTQ